MSRRGAALRNRALFRKLFGRADELQNLRINLIELGQQSFGSIRPQPCDRAFQFPGLDFFTSAIREVTHALRVGASSIRATFDQRWSLSSASSGDGFSGDAMNLQHIVAIKFMPDDSITGGTFGDGR